jgi:hypothetical protein
MEAQLIGIRRKKVEEVKKLDLEGEREGKPL